MGWAKRLGLTLHLVLIPGWTKSESGPEGQFAEDLLKLTKPLKANYRQFDVLENHRIDTALSRLYFNLSNFSGSEPKRLG